MDLFRRFSFHTTDQYSPSYLHMICIGKTKSTSEKGLFIGSSV